MKNDFAPPRASRAGKSPERQARESGPSPITAAELGKPKSTTDTAPDSAERLRLVLEVTGAGIWEVDLRTGRVAIDPKSLAALGYSSEEMPRTTEDWVALQHPEDQARVAAAFQAVLRGETDHYCVEQRTRKQDGTWSWSESRGCVAERNPEGVPVRVIGTHVCIDERKRAEAQLRESEARLRAITDSAQDAIIMMDPHGAISFWNPAAETILGYQTAEAMGRTLHELLAPERYLGAHRAAFPEFSKSGRGIAVGKTVELAARRKDGHEIAVALSLSAVALGEEWHAVGILRDITERKRAEEARRENEAVLTSLFATTPAGAGLLVNRVFQKANAALCRIVGYAEEELVGQSTRRLYPSNEEFDRVGQELYALVKQNGSGILETCMRRKDGTLVNVLLGASPFDPRDWNRGMAVAVLDITERLRAEEEIRKYQKQLADIIQFLPDATLAIDRNKRVIVWNKAIEEMTGIPASEMIGQGDYAYTVPFYGERRPQLMDLVFEDSAAVAARYPKIVRIGDTLTAEFFCNALYSNRGAWAFAKAAPINDVSGRVIGAIETIRDITDRKRAEEALRESEERFRSLVESSPDAIFVQQQRRFVYLNPAMLKLMGASTTEELLGTDCLNCIAPEFQAAVCERIRSMQEGRVKVPLQEQEFLRLNGARVPVETTAVRVPFRGQDAIMVFVRDITERREAEGRIRQQAALLDVSHDAVLVWDVKNGIQFMNPAAQELTGMAFGQSQSQPLVAVLRPRAEVTLEVALRDVLERGNWSGELTLLAAADQPRVVASRWTLLPNAEGKPASVLITCNDITEKKQLEGQYLRAQRLESVGTLASGVAHDLNNILSPVLMGVELLSMQSPDEETRGVLGMMKESARRGVDTVKQLLTFARGTEAQKGPVQPRNLLKEIARLLQQTFPKNIQIYTDYAEEPATVLADPSQLHQVLMNLCVNARDAMPDGGVLFVRLDNRTLDDEGAKIHPKALPRSYVVFKITDSGMGISPEILDRIFDPFFTTKPQGTGTGLGLATVLGIVEDHGGFVLVDSKTGKGTTFEVFLPASTAAEKVNADHTATAPRRGRGELVMVVDDEVPILHLAAEILRHGGYATVTASNASEALHLYEKNHDRIRVVLTDIMMPFGDGRQLITTLYEQNPQLPIVAMSGLATKEFQRETLTRGARSFVRKPFAAEELLKLLAKLLHPNSQQGAAEPARYHPSPLTTSPASSTASEASQAPAILRKEETILLVEDDAKSRQTIGQALRVFGYRVLEAASGEEAIEFWPTYGAAVDVLLADLVMPGGMTGLELTERLQALNPRLKAIISSGYSEESALAGVPDRTDVTYLPKPYETRKLAEVVRKCLDRKP